GGPTAHPHLEVCADCSTRYDALTGWLADLRDEAAAEAAEQFPLERLANQRAQIFRRIEAAERPARVIAFPKFTQPLTSRSSNASRWIAAAAAAGLIVGVGVGQLMDLRHALGPAPITTQALYNVPAPITRAPVVRAVSAMAREEALLSDMDDSLSRASVPELRALDDLTPRAGERFK
ncbi:MAG: hypothetical protein ABJC89_27030, partial [Acidobacteriota bacterium]